MLESHVSEPCADLEWQTPAWRTCFDNIPESYWENYDDSHTLLQFLIYDAFWSLRWFWFAALVLGVVLWYFMGKDGRARTRAIKEAARSGNYRLAAELAYAHERANMQEAIAGGLGFAAGSVSPFGGATEAESARRAEARNAGLLAAAAGTMRLARFDATDPEGIIRYHETRLRKKYPPALYTPKAPASTAAKPTESALKRSTPSVLAGAAEVVTCRACPQKIRIPEGAGDLKLRCPKCRTEFNVY